MKLALCQCAFDQTRCTADQIINCEAFDELHNIWSIAQHTCNRLSVSSSSSSIVQCGRRRSSMSNPWWQCNIYNIQL